MSVHSVEKQKRSKKKERKKDYSRKICSGNSSNSFSRRDGYRSQVRCLMDVEGYDSLEFTKPIKRRFRTYGWNWSCGKALVRSLEGKPADEAYSELIQKLGKKKRAMKLRSTGAVSRFFYQIDTSAFPVDYHACTYEYDSAGWHEPIKLNKPVRGSQWLVENGVLFHHKNSIDSKTNIRTGYTLSEETGEWTIVEGKEIPTAFRHYFWWMNPVATERGPWVSFDGSRGFRTCDLFGRYIRNEHWNRSYDESRTYHQTSFLHFGSWYHHSVISLNTFLSCDFLGYDFVAEFEDARSDPDFEDKALSDFRKFFSFCDSQFAEESVQMYKAAHRKQKLFALWLWTKKKTGAFFVKKSARRIGTSERRALRLPSLEHAKTLFEKERTLRNGKPYRPSHN